VNGAGPPAVQAASPCAPPPVGLPLPLSEAIAETEAILRARRVEVQRAAAVERPGNADPPSTPGDLEQADLDLLRYALHRDRQAVLGRGELWDTADVMAVIRRHLLRPTWLPAPVSPATERR